VGAGGLLTSNGLLLALLMGGVVDMPNGLMEVGGGRGAIKVSKLTRVAFVPKNDSSTVGFCVGCVVSIDCKGALRDVKSKVSGLGGS
jgi:hypothetical protein